MISKAIVSLCPGVAFALENEDYSTIRWLGTPPNPVPTLEQLEAESDKIEAQEIANQYQSDRRWQYPRLEEQLDMIWKSIDSGQPLDKNSDFYKTIAAVKAKYPKTN